MGPINFDNSYARLPNTFYRRVAPSVVSKPELIRVNRQLADELGINVEWLVGDEGIGMMAGCVMPNGAEPIASVYAGHQFGNYVPRLGDGRAMLVGEVVTSGNSRFDIQLKGSGPTPYSRGGDGRSPVGPVLREYIVSEAMYNLGIPTTRALGAIQTGDKVMREGELPGAILTRVARSHIRIGTHQYFAAYGDFESLNSLVRHVVDRHYPEVKESHDYVLEMLGAVIARQADLIAKWQLVGFVHGVMNTDNMLLSGDTVDYGPCAFIDGYDEHAVYSSIDRAGRYAYRNQPGICHWNLACLAQALMPILGDDKDKALEDLEKVLSLFPDLYSRSYQKHAKTKFGLVTEEKDDSDLFAEFFEILNSEGDDFTLAFRRLSDISGDRSGFGNVSDLFQFSAPYREWIGRWKDRCSRDDASEKERQILMYSVNPIYIARNHIVERAISIATEEGKYGPFNDIVDVLKSPYVYRSGLEYYATPPSNDELVTRTFCGT